MTFNLSYTPLVRVVTFMFNRLHIDDFISIDSNLSNNIHIYKVNVKITNIHYKKLSFI